MHRLRSAGDFRLAGTSKTLTNRLESWRADMSLTDLLTLRGPRHRFYVWRVVRSLNEQLRRLSGTQATTGANGPVRRLVLIPSDSNSLIGARGDQAMMQAAEQQLRNACPELAVLVVTTSDEADAAAHRLGFRPLRFHHWNWPLSSLVEAAKAFSADAAILVGADVMDGHYSVTHSAQLLCAADALARNGVPATVLGFSFNDRPEAVLKPLFDGLSPRVRLNVRDEASLERLSAFTRTPAMLVADMAFLLRPEITSARIATIRGWIEARRAVGDRVLAFNIHPMLVGLGDSAARERLIRVSVDALARAAARHRISWLLLPHDYRSSVGDALCLAPIAKGLLDHAVEHVHLDEPLSAGELKAVAGLTDGVIAGRMHLAIATLGQGVPVACLTYQGKFEGLMRHFELPDSLMLAPSEALKDDRLLALIEHFIDDLAACRASVHRWLPSVREASARNISPLVPPRAHGARESVKVL